MYVLFDSCCFFFFLFLFFFVFFFFQAEDGIRDTSVTGVQTCALPISLSVLEEFRIPPTFDPQTVRVFNTNVFHFDAAALLGLSVPWTYFTVKKKVGGRSEERRVGKECRARWSRCQEKKQDKTNLRTGQ